MKQKRKIKKIKKEKQTKQKQLGPIIKSQGFSLDGGGCWNKKGGQQKRISPNDGRPNAESKRLTHIAEPWIKDPWLVIKFYASCGGAPYIGGS